MGSTSEDSKLEDFKNLGNNYVFWVYTDFFLVIIP